MTRIHSSAIVEEGAILEGEVEIGPFCVVGSRVRLSAGVKLESHVVIAGGTTIGSRTHIYSHAILGEAPQVRGGDGGEGVLRIGAGNVIREHVTMHCGTKKGGGATDVGDDGYFMAYSHVAHDCSIGSGVTFANCVALGGHVSIANGANIGGLAAVHQFVRVGPYAFVGGVTGVQADVIPYGLVVGTRAILKGLNLVGLKRLGVPRERIHALRAAYRFMFFGKGPLTDRVGEARERWADFSEVREVTDFVMADAKRPICMPIEGDEDDARDS